MAEVKIVSKENLLYVWQKIKLKLGDKVDKVNGMGLSHNDLTDELKEKILKAGDSSFSGNYEDLINKPTPITKLSELTNDSEFQTASEVNGLITNAIKDIQGITYSIVEELPTTGQAGVIYLVSNGGKNSNIYDEYIFVNDLFEKIGTTEVDLSNYVKVNDLLELTNEEIDAIFLEE